MCPEMEPRGADKGLSTLPGGTSGPRKGRALLPTADQCLALFDTFLWLPSGEWTHMVALGSGLFAQPLDSHLSWHPASLSPEPPHPSKSNGHD